MNDLFTLKDIFIEQLDIYTFDRINKYMQYESDKEYKRLHDRTVELMNYKLENVCNIMEINQDNPETHIKYNPGYLKKENGLCYIIKLEIKGDNYDNNTSRKIRNLMTKNKIYKGIIKHHIDGKIYFNCDYNKREIIKSHGFKWDPYIKLWYIDIGRFNLKKFYKISFDINILPRKPTGSFKSKSSLEKSYLEKEIEKIDKKTNIQFTSPINMDKYKNKYNL